MLPPDLDNAPITLTPPSTTTEKETGKTTLKKDIPVLNSEFEVTLKPQDTSTQDSKPPEPLPEKPERRYPPQGTKTTSEILLNRVKHSVQPRF